jgi:hypothetical protein
MRSGAASTGCQTATRSQIDHSVMAITATEIVCRHAPRIKGGWSLQPPKRRWAI